MAILTNAQARNQNLADLMQQFYAAMVSGQNADGTVFFQPVTASYGGVPASATPITASSGNVAAATATATLTSAAARTAFITGFQATASGATAGLPVNLTVAGVITGTMTYTFTFPAGVLVGATPLVVTFATPVPASAVNTNIVVSLPSGGAGNTNAAVSAQGYLI